MSTKQEIFDKKGKFLGTFRPSEAQDHSATNGCLGIVLGIVIVIYLVWQGWSGIVRPTYHFEPTGSIPTELLVDELTFEKSRFINSDEVIGYFLVGVSSYDTIFFTGIWDDQLVLNIHKHDFNYNTFRSGEEIILDWDSDGVVIENKNPLSERYGEFERWDGGMDSVQFWTALIFLSGLLWFLKKILRR
jgi:hypothetical protein